MERIEIGTKKKMRMSMNMKCEETNLPVEPNQVVQVIQWGSLEGGK